MRIEEPSAASEVPEQSLAGEPLLPVDQHRVRAADAVGAALAEGEGPVEVGLDVHEAVEHPGLGGQIELEILEMRTRVLLGIEALDREGYLHQYTLGLGAKRLVSTLLSENSGFPSASLTRECLSQRAVVPVGEVRARVASPRFLAAERGVGRDVGEVEEVLELEELEEVGVERGVGILDPGLAVVVAQALDGGDGRSHLGAFPYHSYLFHHGLLEGLSNLPAVRALPALQPGDLVSREGVAARGDSAQVGVGDEVGYVPARPAPEDDEVDEAVGAQPVGAVHRDAGALPRGVEPEIAPLAAPAMDAAVEVGGDAAHAVVGRGLDGYRLNRRIDAEVGPAEVGDVGDLLLDDLLSQLRRVEEDVVVDLPVAAHAVAALELAQDGLADEVARRQVEELGRVFLHEALALSVPEHSALAPHRLGDEDAHAGDARGVELVELHVLEGDSPAEGQGETVARIGVGVGGGLEHPAEAAGREHDRLGPDGVQLARSRARGRRGPCRRGRP